MSLSTSVSSLPGISVLVCCYNSAERLAPTLTALARQQMAPANDFGVEVFIIDNASSDATTPTAHTLLAELAFPFPHQVLYEAEPGKGNALQQGFARARYRYVCIVDDDNWLAPDYLSLAWQIMEANPEIGALGGLGESQCEISPPEWFSDFAIDYAVGPQAERSGDLTETKRFLWGAGQVIRKASWQQVLDAAFDSLIVAKPGTKPSGEDNEMCYALILAGYRIWYDERLRFIHFIPAQRLTWSYLQRTYNANAASEVKLRPYLHFLEQAPPQVQPNKPAAWLRDGLYTWRYLLPNLYQAVRSGEWKQEGSHSALRTAYYWTVFRKYLRQQLDRDKSYTRVQSFIQRLSNSRATPQIGHQQG